MKLVEKVVLHKRNTEKNNARKYFQFTYQIYLILLSVYFTLVEPEASALQRPTKSQRLFGKLVNKENVSKIKP